MKYNTQLLQLVLATLTIIIGHGLLIAGFVVNPVGEISNSVLVAYGETLTFAGAVFGVDYHYRYRSSQLPDITHNDNENDNTR